MIVCSVPFFDVTTQSPCSMLHLCHLLTRDATCSCFKLDQAFSRATAVCWPSRRYAPISLSVSTFHRDLRSGAEQLDYGLETTLPELFLRLLTPHTSSSSARPNIPSSPSSRWTCLGPPNLFCPWTQTASRRRPPPPSFDCFPFAILSPPVTTVHLTSGLQVAGCAIVEQRGGRDLAENQWARRGITGLILMAQFEAECSTETDSQRVKEGRRERDQGGWRCLGFYEWVP